MFDTMMTAAAASANWSGMTRLRVVCARCGRVLSSGDHNAATSHGACEVCADRLLHEDD